MRSSNGCWNAPRGAHYWEDEMETVFSGDFATAADVWAEFVIEPPQGVELVYARCDGQDAKVIVRVSGAPHVVTAWRCGCCITDFEQQWYPEPIEEADIAALLEEEKADGMFGLPHDTARSVLDAKWDARLAQLAATEGAV